MKNYFKITLFLITSLLLSCSDDTDETSETIDNEIISMIPNFGYEGDEIAFKMANAISQNSNVEITYENQQATITSINNDEIKHIMLSSDLVSKNLKIDNQNISIQYLYGLKPYINCSNCKEKAFPYSGNDEVESAIASVFKKNNEIYLIKTYRNNNYDYKTSLLKTDADFNLISETILFNRLPISKAIFENDSFVITNELGVFSFDLTGNEIWSYNTSISAGTSSSYIGYLTNSIYKTNSHYYIIKKPNNSDSQPIEIIKLDLNGQLTSSIYVPNPDNNNELQNAIILTNINNKIVVFTSFCCENDNWGYVILDDNDNIIRNTFNQIEIRNINYVEGNSIYFNRHTGGSYPNFNFELVKISLDNNNYFQTDWTKDDYNGNIIKYNNKYLSIQNDKILVFNDNNFNNPTIFNSSLVDYEGVLRWGSNVYDNDVYLFGHRTIEFANDYHSLVGKYDLNYIIN